jgi:hypothetical protein
VEVESWIVNMGSLGLGYPRMGPQGRMNYLQLFGKRNHEGNVDCHVLWQCIRAAI